MSNELTKRERIAMHLYSGILSTCDSDGRLGGEGHADMAVCEADKLIKALNGSDPAKELKDCLLVSFTLECEECDGRGYHEGGNLRGAVMCDECEGTGDYNQDVPIPWTKIKEIYAMAAKHLGKELDNE